MDYFLFFASNTNILAPESTRKRSLLSTSTIHRRLLLLGSPIPAIVGVGFSFGTASVLNVLRSNLNKRSVAKTMMVTHSQSEFSTLRAACFWWMNVIVNGGVSGRVDGVVENFSHYVAPQFQVSTCLDLVEHVLYQRRHVGWRADGWCCAGRCQQKIDYCDRWRLCVFPYLVCHDY